MLWNLLSRLIIFPYGYLTVLASFIEKFIISLLNLIILKNQLIVYMWVISRLCSTDLYFILAQIVYLLLLFNFFLFSKLFVFLSKFYNPFINLYITAYWDFNWDCIESIDIFEKINILTVLSLPVHETGISPVIYL